MWECFQSAPTEPELSEFASVLSMMKTYKELPDDAGSNIIGQVTAQITRLQKRLASVKHTVAVMSGKGGVGKSAVTTNLAAALALEGNAVGVVDADINGPSIAKMMGVRNAALEYSPAGVTPAVNTLGIKVISMDLLLAEDEAPVLWNAPTQKDAFTWRATMEVGALREFIGDTEWGELDYLLLDLPPGADRLPNVVELLPNLGGVIVVTIPSEVSQFIVKKSLAMAQHILNVPIIGVVENMAYHICQHCGEKEPLFSTELKTPSVGAVSNRATEPFSAATLGSIPFDAKLAYCSDKGTPYMREYPNTPASLALTGIAKKIQHFFT